MILLRSIVPVALTLVACGGSSFSDLGPGPDGGGGNDAAADGAARPGADASTSTDGATSGPDGTTPPADAAMAGDAPAGGCPNVTGRYAITITEGGGVATGCGDLSDKAPQCIRALNTSSACVVTFVSVPNASGNGVGINGDPTIQSDGSFSGATLREGTAVTSRTGCTGTWDAQTSTMTVDCGGTGSSQSCVVSLMRTNDMCN